MLFDNAVSGGAVPNVDVKVWAFYSVVIHTGDLDVVFFVHF